MEKISSLFNLPPHKKRGSERGDLLEYFSQKTEKPIGYIAYRLTGFKVPDLYYLKSRCDQEEKRGTPWGKVFFGSIKQGVDK